jgi:LmbE family N-acetylglucosaminyl deacetylase
LDRYALVVAPHPDDAEFGAGGTIARWVAEGRSVVLVVCTNGDRGSADPAVDSATLARLRREEQTKAAKVLGVVDLVFLDLPDQGLEDTPEYRRQLVREVRRYRPTVVATTDPYRRYIWHRDHRITGQVTLDAIYPFARDRLAYPDLVEEGLEPHKVKEVWLWGAEETNHCIDVSATFATKLKALRCHRSQVGTETGALEERLRQRCRTAARGESFELGEAFHRVVAPA